MWQRAAQAMQPVSLARPFDRGSFSLGFETVRRQLAVVVRKR